MTFAQWTDSVAGCLEHWWAAPDEWTPQKSQAYFLALGAYDLAEVGHALELVRREGSPFRPAAGVIESFVLGRGGQARSPEEAWSLIEEAVRRVNRSVYAPDFHERHQAAVDWLAEQDRVVAAWAARRGLCGAGSLGHEPVGDPEHGGVVRGALAKDYREQLQLAQERVALGRPAVPADALYVRAAGALHSGGMGELLEHLRPAGQLPAAGDVVDAAAGELA